MSRTLSVWKWRSGAHGGCDDGVYTAAVHTTRSTIITSPCVRFSASLLSEVSMTQILHSNAQQEYHQHRIPTNRIPTNQRTEPTNEWICMRVSHHQASHRQLIFIAYISSPTIQLNSTTAARYCLAIASRSSTPCMSNAWSACISLAASLAVRSLKLDKQASRPRAHDQLKLAKVRQK
jgi:hypothetical protein